MDQFHKCQFHNAPFRAEMCTFLFWMEHCGMWKRCIVGFVNWVNWNHLIIFCNYGSNDPVRSQFCTCHDSSAVMACAQLWPNQFIICRTRRAAIFFQDFDYELIELLWDVVHGHWPGKFNMRYVLIGCPAIWEDIIYREKNQYCWIIKELWPMMAKP